MTNPTKQEVIDWYMEKFADKNVTFWCRISFRDTDWKNKLHWVCLWKLEGVSERGYSIKTDDGRLFIEKVSEVEIIWHPLTIGRLYQEYYFPNELYTEQEYLEDILWKARLLDKTIYERVENEEVLEILVSIMNAYE